MQVDGSESGVAEHSDATVQAWEARLAQAIEAGRIEQYEIQRHHDFLAITWPAHGRPAGKLDSGTLYW